MPNKAASIHKYFLKVLYQNDCDTDILQKSNSFPIKIVFHS